MDTHFRETDGSRPTVGVGAVAIRLPRPRVRLEDWCEWTGEPWPKVRDTVGRSFRVMGPAQSVYTLAADAVLSLILANDVDPRSVGFLALGTESSTDNSAGAILVKGMVDDALEQLGRPRLSRGCEVPEFKHACLGGVYAAKAALRYLLADGRGRRAIVASVDVAEYERGSSGEQTQGAGAVAQLFEEDPALYSMDVWSAGSAAAYRGIDFRKPVSRHLGSPPPAGAVRFPDYPVFNGKYSTICYTDEALDAVARLLSRLDKDARTLFHEVEGVFMHRPYHRLPVNVLAALYVWGLTRNPDHLPELEALCREAGARFEAVLAEAGSNPDLFAGALGGKINEEAYPEAMKVVKHFRDTPKFADVAARKMSLGSDAMRDLGNIYTGSLPAWIAAGLEEALERDTDLARATFLTIGYGSGDAAEAMLIRVADRWREAAARIGFGRALRGAVDLSRDQYEALHDGLSGPCPEIAPSGEFVVDRVGDGEGNGYQDQGIEYYRYVP